MPNKYVPLEVKHSVFGEKFYDFSCPAARVYDVYEMHIKHKIGSDTIWKLTNGPRHSIRGLIAIIYANGRKPPSVDRMILIALNSPESKEQDVADAFGVTVDVVLSASARRKEIELAEPLPPTVHSVEKGFVFGDPSPAQIAQGCADIQKQWGKTDGRLMQDKKRKRWEVPRA